MSPETLIAVATIVYGILAGLKKLPALRARLRGRVAVASSVAVAFAATLAAAQPEQIDFSFIVSALLAALSAGGVHAAVRSIRNN